MHKPDFGIGMFFAIRWTPERVAYLRHCAAQGMSATQIAVEIGLPTAGGQRIAMACQKADIKLRGKPGRRRHGTAPILVEIPEHHAPVLSKLGAKYRLPIGEVVLQLLAAAIEQGEHFLDNLLDLAADD